MEAICLETSTLKTLINSVGTVSGEEPACLISAAEMVLHFSAPMFKKLTFIGCDQFNSDGVCTAKNKYFAVEALKNDRLAFSSINA